MKFSVRFIENKPKFLKWLYLLIFSIGLLIAVPFVAMAMVSEICLFVGNVIIQKLSDWLDIEFTL